MSDGASDRQRFFRRDGQRDGGSAQDSRPAPKRYIKEGETATSTVSATGTAPLLYQWQFNGQDIRRSDRSRPISCATRRRTQSGKYAVRVSNPVGSVTSASATLVVSTPPAANMTSAMHPILPPRARSEASAIRLSWPTTARGTSLCRAFSWANRSTPETNGQPNVDATGDDLNPEKLDDEDGVQFLTPLGPGQSAQVAVTASQPGRLDAWIDFNRNKSWADQGDQIFLSTASSPG